MAEDRSAPTLPDVDGFVPSSARIWNYWMGGRDNYEVDRVAGSAYATMYPDIVTLARQSRRFLVRAVSHLAATGTRQFLDIGTGLPTTDNTHEVAQRIAPEARVVYVDNDPLVLAYARALLVTTTRQGETSYIDADLHEPDAILAEAAGVLDFDEPIAVMFMGVLGHVTDLDEARAIVARAMAAVPPGSHLLLWDGTDTNPRQIAAAERYKTTGAVPYIPRSPEQIATLFAGLDPLEPGLVSISHWRPESPTEPVDGYGGVARKP